MIGWPKVIPNLKVSKKIFKVEIFLPSNVLAVRLLKKVIELEKAKKNAKNAKKDLTNFDGYEII